MRRAAHRFGLLGLGNVGKNVLLESIATGVQFRFHWFADSNRIITKRDYGAFTSSEIRELVRVKEKFPNTFGSKYQERTSALIREFHSPSEETEILETLISDPKDNWIIIDTTSAGARANYKIVSGAMGCLSYCTANKSPWADYKLCVDLYRMAEKSQTLLGLNCTAGVWLDQMDILPILMQRLVSGCIVILKRDNPSLNIFFEKVGKGKKIDQALYEIARGGYLEPGATDLLPEVRDQVVKANIAVNICGIIRNRVPSQVIESSWGRTLESLDPPNLADWHLRGRKKGMYPALITLIHVDADHGEIHSRVGFEDLPRGHPLAEDFDRKNVISIQASSDAKFNWSCAIIHGRRGSFVHAGRGGALVTARKLLHESKRAIVLSRCTPPPNAVFSPLPILCGLTCGRRDAIGLEREIARTL